MLIILGLIASYLIGSLPTAYLLGRLLKGIDIRKFGSGNVGATNALRILGKPAGITVLALDVFKGFAAVVFLTDQEILRIVLGFACICGHNWSIFLGFKGGKGVAATLGVLLGLAITLPGLKVIFGLIILTWILLFLITRIVSVASVITAILLPIYMALFKQSGVLIFSCVILSIFIILRHKSNLKRIFRNEEKRLF